jgi:hypothetical protein
MYDLGGSFKKKIESGVGVSPEHAPLVEALKNRNYDAVKQHLSAGMIPGAEAMKHLSNTSVEALQNLGATGINKHIKAIKTNHVYNYARGLLSKDTHTPKERGVLGNLWHSRKLGYKASLAGGALPAVAALHAGGISPEAFGAGAESLTQGLTTATAEGGSRVGRAAEGAAKRDGMKDIKDFYEAGHSGKAFGPVNRLKNVALGLWGSPVARSGKTLVERAGGIAGELAKIPK